MNFTFGTPFEIRLDVGCGAASYSTDSTAANTLADLAHTATWGGFSSVTDARGTLAAYNFSSASGTNFAQAIVPEPGAYAMVVVAGAAGLVGACKRRGRLVSLQRQSRG